MELQQGDWLCIDGKPQRYITQVASNIDLQDDIEPIPITNKILEDSGWYRAGETYVLKSTVRFGWKPKTKELIVGYTTVPFFVIYVHELQHFLNVFRSADRIIVK